MSSFSLFTKLINSSNLQKPPELPPKVKCHYEEPYLVTKFSQTFCRHLISLDPEVARPLVVVAIGTDRSTGDSLGPLVGTKLDELKARVNVFGTLDNPVHATNLTEKLADINLLHPNPLIIAIDACLGRVESVGSITLAAGSLKPGAGVNKSLPLVGDLHFTGIVNVGGYMEYFVLQNTRLNLVWKMANIIASSIHQGVLLANYQAKEPHSLKATLQ